MHEALMEIMEPRILLREKGKEEAGLVAGSNITLPGQPHL